MGEETGSVSKALVFLMAGHEAFHEMEDPGPDDETVTVSLHERDMLLVGMALPALEILFMDLIGTQCFHDASLDLQRRLMEVTKVQHPEWTRSGREDS